MKKHNAMARRPVEAFVIVVCTARSKDPPELLCVKRFQVSGIYANQLIGAGFVIYSEVRSLLFMIQFSGIEMSRSETCFYLEERKMSQLLSHRWTFLTVSDGIVRKYSLNYQRVLSKG